DLLQVDPALRPTGDELMERLGLDPESSRYEATGTGFGIGLIGRHGELARLRTALEEVRRGRAATLQIRGRSGMGKTALVEEFLEEVRDRGGLVLTGRCFERESVPYKALDPLVDALARHLLSLPAPERDRLLPADLGLLARVFRVVERLTGPVPPAVELGDPLEQRRRAFAALRDLLDQVARQQLLVLHLDDLQWSDGDSLGRLRELLRPPAPPPLLLLLGLRSEPEDERPLVREFLEAEVSAPPLEIGPLSPEEAGEMAARLLKAESPGDRARAAAIAREAEGVPIFLEEMVRYLRMAAVERLPTAEAARLTLEEVIGHRVGVLPAASRDLLEIVAVAGQPLPQRVAWDAAGIRGQGWRALAVLSAQRLVRTHGRDQGDPVECFHDRIRTTLVGSMAPPRLRERHLALAQALDAGGDGDPERLLLHYLEGGDRGRAAIHARTAADQAYRAFAFDRAADLYRRCAELQPEGEPVRLGLDLRLADSLEKAGRGPEAAEAFLAAASVRPPEEGWRLVGRAATICLLSGHLQQGKALLRQVLQDLGIRVPGSTAALLLSLAGLRLRLRLRGTAFRERAEETLPREILDRVDACWGAALGFGLADPVEGLVYQNQALLMALEAGEPRRVARTLSMEAAFLVVGGGVRGLGRAEAYFATAEHIADRLEDQALQGALAMARAVAMLQVGRWRRSRDAARVALDHLGHAPSESAWDLITARIYDLAAAGFLGDLRGALELYHEILRTARERGDLHSLSHVRLGMEINAHLIAGDPAAAREDVEEAISQWVGPGFTLQHFYAERALCQIDLFDGRFADAARRALLLWTRVQRSTVRSVGFCRGLALDILGRTLVAPGVEAIPRVQRIAARLEREGPLWTRAHAVMLRSQAARARGDGPGAAVLLRQAVQRYEDADMAVHAGAARWRLAELTDASRIATEREALAARGAADPEGLVRMLAPAGDVTGPSRGGDGSRGAAVP
ncbi:MAG: AAA family ATPase, partial [Deltaproteobacteria bacterium]|nr:AAA family ATPase [Deltaproteobacteria bacterium]